MVHAGVPGRRLIRRDRDPSPSSHASRLGCCTGHPHEDTEAETRNAGLSCRRPHLLSLWRELRHIHQGVPVRVGEYVLSDARRVAASAGERSASDVLRPLRWVNVGGRVANRYASTSRYGDDAVRTEGGPRMNRFKTMLQFKQSRSQAGKAEAPRQAVRGLAAALRRGLSGFTGRARTPVERARRAWWHWR